MIIFKPFCKISFCLLALLIFQFPQQSFGKSAFSPRHTGMEPPGEMKTPDNMPGRPLSRTAEGGRGYIDAYGNTVTPQEPREHSEKSRLRRGAYSNADSKKETATLPVPTKDISPKLWKFQ